MIGGLTVPVTRVLFADLEAQVTPYLSKPAVREIYDAYLFAAEAHDDKPRASGEHYISHPLSVAIILAQLRLDKSTLIATLLHDVIEDTSVTEPQITALFGSEIAAMVEGVSKITELAKEQPLNAEAETMRKMLIAMTKDVRVILIKLADRLHNISTIKYLKPEKQRKISRQTLDIYAPIANRLGIHEIRSQMEDACFKVLWPEDYDLIKNKLALHHNEGEPVEQEMCAKLTTTFIEKGLDNVSISSRTKSPFSIFQKMRAHNISIDEVKDIHGIRVVVSNTAECYQALGLVHSTFKPMQGVLKDYIAIEKPNGYQSLHTSVIGWHGFPIEVQIRTQKMNRQAEIGLASHWMYKELGHSYKDVTQQVYEEWLHFINTQDNFEGGLFLEHLRSEISVNKISAYTPSGEIKYLPTGATAVDFAYAVHSDIGYHCKRAKVNGVFVPLNTVLHSNDRIRIQTAPTSKPQPNWLNFVVTTRARTAIRHFLANQKGEEARSIGRRLLTQALRDAGFQRNRLTAEDKNKLMALYELESWDDVLRSIGSGDRQPIMIAHQLLNLSNDEAINNQLSRSSLAIQGADKLLVNFANCCSPLPHEAIVGVFSAGKGLVIHRDECKNTTRYKKHADQWVKLHWSSKPKGPFYANIKVLTDDEPGVLREVTQIIAENAINIEELNLVNDHSGAEIRLKLNVRDTVQLDETLKRIDALPNVYTAIRTSE